MPVDRGRGGSMAWCPLHVELEQVRDLLMVKDLTA